MRLAYVSLVAALALLAGCVDAGIESIEDARERRQGRAPQESTEPDAPERAGPPTPTNAPTRPISPTAPLTPSAPTPATPTPPSPVQPATTPPPSPVTPAPPPPSPTPPPPATWPTQGSSVRLEMWASDGSRSWANWTYEGTDWRGRCEGAGETRDFRARDPPHWPLFNTRDVPPVGGTVKAWYLEDCRILSLDASYAGTRDGRHFATASGFATSWDVRTGLVLSWERGTTFGRLAATDAPLSAT